MKFLWWLILALVALVLILFAVSNREAVLVELWPLPLKLELPLYLVVLGMLVIGFFAGQFVTWIGGWRWRREARRSRERIARLERELDAARAETRPPVAALPR
ncbi:MAG TPA: lipopolysaccharide assembly protein LapA domain-containing protein [Stellaceae bacterium]|jgi:putative membrane protein|nr:lipopolysaccharide assembly protein LapA domain-containing protein [Stellaceae bacterium]